jgi:hypothetical protein
LRVYERRYLLWRKCKIWMSCVTELSELQSVLPMKCVPVSTWWETEYHLDVCCATEGGHIEICRAHKELYEVLCLKMYRLLQYILWLKVYDVSFYCHLKPDILHSNRKAVQMQTSMGTVKCMTSYLVINVFKRDPVGIVYPMKLSWH